MKIVINGSQGVMGQNLVALCEKGMRGAEVAALVDRVGGENIYTDISSFDGKGDVIIDFSHHSALPSLLEYAKKTHTPLVIATTGHTEEELDLMRQASEEIAIFFSGNFSIGINLIINLAKQAARTLGTDFDIEIIEKHHNKKLDAPSGTALMLANSIAEEREENEYVYDRHSVRKARESKEIGIHAVRGGTIVGEHEVIFAGTNEVVTISHSAASREIFATGALRASAYIAKKSTGLYNMSDLIENK